MAAEIVGNAIREALEPFAKAADLYDRVPKLDIKDTYLAKVPLGDLRRARTAYEAPSPVAVEEAGAEAVGDCANCDGEGWAYSDLEGRTEECHRCNGTGKEDAASTPSPQIGNAGAGPVGEAVAFRCQSSNPAHSPSDILVWNRETAEIHRLDGWTITALYARPVEEPGEVERLTRERDAALDRAEEADRLRVEHAVARAAAEAALAETRERLEKREEALREIASLEDYDVWTANGHAKCNSIARAALTGDAQEAKAPAGDA